MKFLMILVALVLGGCGGTLNASLQKALVFEDQIHAQVAQLETAFEAAVTLLPADKQADARAKMATAFAVLARSLATKDAMLQTAIDASANDVDVSSIAVDIVIAVQDIISIVQGVGGSETVTERALTETQAMKIRWVK